MPDSRLAVRISARAIRRCGELLKTFKQERGGDRKSADYQETADGQLISQQQAGSAAGLSQRQIKTSVRVSNAPKEEFDAAVESEQPPTITHY